MTRRISEFSYKVKYKLTANSNSQSIENFRQFLTVHYWELGEIKKAGEYALLCDDSFWLKYRLMPRRIEITFDFKFKYLMENYYQWIEPGRNIFSLPISASYQKLISAESDPPFTEIIDEGRLNYGIYDFSSGFPERLVVKLVVENMETEHKPEYLLAWPDQAEVSLEDDELSYYANYTDDYYCIDDPLILETVKEITKGKRTLLEKVIAVHQWVSRNITHIYDQEGYKTINKLGDPEFSL